VVKKKTESGTDRPKNAHRMITDVCNMRVGDRAPIIIERKYNKYKFDCDFSPLQDKPLEASVMVDLDAVILGDAVFKEGLFRILKSTGFKCVRDKWLTTGKYARFREFKLGRERVDVLYPG